MAPQLVVVRPSVHEQHRRSVVRTVDEHLELDTTVTSHAHPAMMPTNQYVEVRNGCYYVAATRIGLDVVTYEFREGRSPEEIFEAYPSIGSLAKLYGTITFILEHPKEIDSYLKEQDERWEEFKARNPLAPEMAQRFERARRELSVKQP